MHCLFKLDGSEKNASNTTVIVGENNLTDRVNEGGQKIRVAKFIKHPDFAELGQLYDIQMINDIAILELSESINFTDKVAPISLPTNREETYAGKTATVAGWGRTSEGGNFSLHELKETNLTVLASTNDACQVETNRG